jgi:vacuolar protein sorting-associated protein 35
MCWLRNIFLKVGNKILNLFNPYFATNSGVTVLTKVFPDEYHLHTLDIMLSAIARLNPHVDMKKIVIGLMDRLSSYAARESEESPSAGEEKEEDVPKKLQKLDLEENGEETTTDPDADKANAMENGETSDGSTKAPENTATAPSEGGTTLNGDAEGPRIKIPGDIKLYEVFYEQVVNLVKTRGLSIQDTIALLVSLVNLALYVPALSRLPRR